MRASSLPAMWSWVTRTARAPSSSARATPIGPPIGSNTTTSPSAGQRRRARAAGRRRRSRRRRRRPRTRATRRREPVHCTIDGGRLRHRSARSPSADVDAEPPDLAVEPVDERAVRTGDRGQPAETRRPLDERRPVPARGRDPGRLQPGRTAADHDDVARRVRRARTSRGPRSRARSSARRCTSRSGCGRRAPGTSGCSGCTAGSARLRPARSLATRSGSAIWARVISTPSHARRVVVAAERPLGLADVDDRALQDDRHVDRGCGSVGDSSMLNPVGWWKSGRVCSTEKIEPRTTTR